MEDYYTAAVVAVRIRRDRALGYWVDIELAERGKFDAYKLCLTRWGAERVARNILARGRLSDIVGVWRK